MRWARLVLVLLMVVNVWYRAYLRAGRPRGDRDRPLAPDHRRQRAARLRRGGVRLHGSSGAAGGCPLPRPDRVQAAARLLDLHAGRRSRGVQRAGDPDHVDPVRPRDDRDGLVDRASAGWPGRGLPGGRAVRPPEHRSLPVRQRLESRAFHQLVRGPLAGDDRPRLGPRRPALDARRRRLPGRGRAGQAGRAGACARVRAGADPPGVAERRPLSKARAARRPGVRAGHLGHRGGRDDDRRGPRRRSSRPTRTSSSRPGRWRRTRCRRRTPRRGRSDGSRATPIPRGRFPGRSVPPNTWSGGAPGAGRSGWRRCRPWPTCSSVPAATPGAAWSPAGPSPPGSRSACRASTGSTITSCRSRAWRSPSR